MQRSLLDLSADRRMIFEDCAYIHKKFKRTKTSVTLWVNKRLAFLHRRRFTQDFKRSIVEQLLSETAGPVELCRRYNISSGLLYTWKRQYADGKLNAEPSREAELAARVRELECLLGKVTLENEFLKRAVRNNLKRTEKRESSLPKIAPLSKAFTGGANSWICPGEVFIIRGREDLPIKF